MRVYNMKTILRYFIILNLLFCLVISYAQANQVDVITIDGSVDRSTARKTVGNAITLQGNYDPAEMIETNGKTVESVQATAREMLEALGPQRLIANLGEGLGGLHDEVAGFLDPEVT